MRLELWLSNLWFYSLQTGILILVGGFLPWIFRLRAPGILHLYWRLLMVACLLLVLQPRAPITVPEPIARSIGRGTGCYRQSVSGGPEQLLRQSVPVAGWPAGHRHTAPSDLAGGRVLPAPSPTA